MKIQFMKMLMVLFLLAGVTNVPVRAQALIEGRIEADVPFAFIVKDTSLPAGKYMLTRLDQTNPQVLEIRSANGGKAVVMFEAENAQIAQIPRNPELVFNKVGEQYFLSQIWADDTDIGYQLPMTKAEERLEASGMKSEHRSILAKMFKKTKNTKN